MFTLGPEQRLLAWRTIREEMQPKTIKEQHEQALALWRNAPLSNQFLSPDLQEEWPDPWTLVRDNYYDQIGVTLGIYYTLVLETGNKDYIIQCVENNEGIISFVLHVPSKTTLNYDWCGEVNIELIKNCQLRYSYSWEDFDIR